MLHLHGAGNGIQGPMHAERAFDQNKLHTQLPRTLWPRKSIFFKEGKRERGGEGERMLMSCKSVSQSEVCMFFMLVNELIFITSTVTFLLRNCSSWPCNALCSPGRTFHQQSILVLEFHELIKFFLFSAEEHVLNKHGAVYKKAEVVHN